MDSEYVEIRCSGCGFSLGPVRVDIAYSDKPVYCGDCEYRVDDEIEDPGDYAEYLEER